MGFALLVVSFLELQTLRRKGDAPLDLCARTNIPNSQRCRLFAQKDIRSATIDVREFADRDFDGQVLPSTN
jgi:hypothetical protein